jgi:hypothetical protein
LTRTRTRVVRQKLLRIGAGLALAAGGATAAAPAASATTCDNIIFDNIRYPDGSWQGWEAPAQPPGAGLDWLSDAALPDGSLFMAGLAGGELYYTIRDSSGSFSPWYTESLPSSGAEYLAVAALPDGYVHVDIVGTNESAISDNVFFPDGTGYGSWQGWERPTQPPGSANEMISAAGLPNGNLHLDVIAEVNGVDTIWDNVRFPNGTWQGWEAPAQPPTSAVRITDAAEPNGDLHIEAVGETGVLYDNIRYPSGGWQGWGTPTQPPGSIRDIAATGMPDGDMQLAAMDFSGQGWGYLYHDIRYADGQWQGWRQVAQPPVSSASDSDVTIAGMPNGDSHMDAETVDVGSGDC